jgi:hypothetical protein
MAALSAGANRAWISKAINAALGGLDNDMRAALGWLDDPYLESVTAAARRLHDGAVAEQRGRLCQPAQKEPAIADVIHDPRTDWCACPPEGADRCDYRLLADAVIAHLDVRDGDEAEVALCIEAVERAAPQSLADSGRFQVGEARGALARWDRAHGPDIYGTDRVLADQLRAMLALVGQLAPNATQE